MKRTLALCLAALLVFALCACIPDENALTFGDFTPHHDNKATQMPGSRFYVNADTTLDYHSKRGIHIGDNAKDIAAEYGDLLCDISYEDTHGFVTLDKANMKDFIAGALPRYFTVSYMMLSTGGEAYTVDQLDDAPENDEYTIYYLEFEVTDEFVTGILFSVVKPGEEAEADEVLDEPAQQEAPYSPLE